KEAEKREKWERCENGGGDGKRPVTIRCYSNCGKPSYNIRMCQLEVEMSNIYSFEWF
ncbi:uncharacterized protein K441DRAFT_567413, partial [Cenococcum geophilum 1.58]|uniref:uncharacterized protein n=1 Tax=Cenococcum geophilum 1.58 TaxID=794803 RepID=UPI00358EF357